MKITKDYLRRIITEEIQNMEEQCGPGVEVEDEYEVPSLDAPLEEDEEGHVAAGPIAIIDYDEGGITISDGWVPPKRLDFIAFEDIEGGEEDPKSGDEIEKIVLDFFEKNGVKTVRDEQMDVSEIEPQEWLDTMIMNHPAGSERRPPEGHAGGHSVRNRRELGMSPFDHDPWED